MSFRLRALSLTIAVALLVTACASARPTPMVPTASTPPAASGSDPSGTPSPGTPGTPGPSPSYQPGSSGEPPEPSAPGPTPTPASPDPSQPAPTVDPEPTPDATDRPTAPPTQSARLSVEFIADGFRNPNGVTHAGDDRLFLSEQEGWIEVFERREDGSFENAGRFLDIQDLAACCGERGLLGLVFHPDYQENGLFYVTYSDNRHSFALDERRVSEEDPNRADPDYRRQVFRIYKPYNYHWGGHMEFGPDGYLWLGMGDGGFGGTTNDPGDPDNLSQRLDSLFGKMMRIDPADPDGDGPATYGIPPDNPYLDQDGALPEIWARGLRNPWRWSFDRLTGDLWVADTGHTLWEEVNRAPWPDLGRERNYGWKLREGPACYSPSTNCDPRGRTSLPISSYRHETSPGGFRCAVTGGFVYRGSASPALESRYLFGDYCSGEIFSIDSGGPDEQRARVLLDTDMAISAMGEDVDGELYVTDYKRDQESLYRLVGEPAD
ncbi:PQQ-dependent sugar dehydrogenase [soil metagenome]